MSRISAGPSSGAEPRALRWRLSICVAAMLGVACSSASDATHVQETAGEPVAEGGERTWRQAPTLLDATAYERIESVPPYADAEFVADGLGSAYGAVILTVSDSAHLVMLGMRPSGGADVWGEIALPREAAEALVGGGSIELDPSELDSLRVARGQESVDSTPLRWRLSVDDRGLLDMSVALQDGTALQAFGRLTGACKYVDAESSARHVVDSRTNPFCDRLIGWL